MDHQHVVSLVVESKNIIISDEPASGTVALALMQHPEISQMPDLLRPDSAQSMIISRHPWYVALQLYPDEFITTMG